MQNTHLSEFVHLLRSLTASFLIAGVVMGGSGAVTSVAAELTGRGSTMVQSVVQGKIVMVHAAPSLRAAAPAPMPRNFDADMQIALGMLLLLTGCTLHCMWVACHAHARKKHARR
jgi:hypothetical protein